MALSDAAVSKPDEHDIFPLATICQTPMEIPHFLKLAISLSSSLADLHQSNIVHKNLCPDDILINRKTGEITISGYFSSFDGRHSGRVEKSVTVQESFLAYTSPEQMGRMNQVIDHRTDLYSTGVILYQLLTGKLPFAASDLLEWVHCHIARVPKSPRDILDHIPSAISDIVMKLLAKAVEERYQTAIGLRLDLERCLAAWQAKKEIKAFALGSGDISDRLLIPQKLFGREKNLDKLQAAFSGVVEKGIPEMVMITGYSGIGKTALVRQLYHPVVKKHGFFIWGKSDQYKRNIPYGIVIEAFQELIRQLLTKQDLTQWKKKLLNVLGLNGGLLVDILPRIELVIGPQPPVPELPLKEAEHRFNMVFKQFMGVFADKSHPLVIFLDDLQWIDPASLKLLKYIAIDPGVRYLLIVGAYRDNEVDDDHPLKATLDEISGCKSLLRTIHLTSLSFRDLSNLIADTLHCTITAIKGLAQLVYKKTEGNPFFVIQFLKTLHSKNLLVFDTEEYRWVWDIEQITNSDYTDNVVDLMVSKLQDLPEKTRNTLRLASCIGNRFDLRTLAVISNIEEDEAEIQVSRGVVDGLLLASDSNYYTFLHDRVQQAAYSLIPESDRAIVHLKIGRLLFKNTSANDLEDQVFELASHMNQGASLLFDPEERYQVAQINLLAGRKAKDATAYQGARDYLLTGISLVKDATWHERFELIYGLLKELAIVEYLVSNYNHSEELIRLLLTKAQTVLEKAELYNTLIVQYTLTARYQDAISSGREALELLEITFPKTNIKEEYNLQLQQYRLALEEQQIMSLADGPEMSDPRIRAGLTLLSNMMVPSRYTDSKLFSLVNIVIVNLSLKYGPTAKSTVGFNGLGMVFNAETVEYYDAYELGLLALKISERFNDPAQKCQACFVLGHYLSHWVRHLKLSDTFNDQGFAAGLAAGEMQWTGYILAYKLFQPFYRGDRIALIRKELPELLAFTQRTKNQWASDTLLGIQLALNELQGASEKNTRDLQEGDDFSFLTDESQFLAGCKKNKSFGAMGRYAVMKAQIHYLYGRMDQALETVRMAKKFRGYFSSSISVAALNFYHSLILAALCDKSSGKVGNSYLKKIRANQVQMGLWAESCKENYHHQFLLIQAETARIKGDELYAEQLYEQAISSADKNGFVQNEALALDLASRFYRRRGFSAIATLYLQRARDCYRDWGAEGKARQLDQVLLQDKAKPDTQDLDFQIGHLDAITVIKASQAISGEIVIERLLETLLKTMLENAGAQKGCLLLVNGEELSLAATAMVIEQEIIVEQQDPFPIASVLPESMATYVRRTHEPVILGDVQQYNTFSTDPYFLVDQPKSLLCLPLLRQADLIGVLYLENSLVKRAFTSDRIAVLELLAAQAVISLENAVLYQERSRAEEALRKSEEKYRVIFENSGTGLIFVEEDTTVSICNREFEKLTGYSKEEVEHGMKWTSFIADKDDLERMVGYHQLRRIDPLAAPQAYEFKLRHRSGVIKTMLITVAMIPDRNQSLAAISDISELKQAEGDLARLATAIEQSPEAIFIADTDFAISYVNPAFERLSGYEREEIVGQHANILDGNNDASRYHLVRKTLQAGEIWSGRLRNRKKDGSYFEAEVKASPVRDRLGAIINYIGMHRDITREVHLENELRQAQKMEAIGTLAGGIAHDFNNILTSIIGYSEMAKLKVLSDRSTVEYCLEQVLKSGKRAAELVGQILTFGRRTEHEMKVVQIVSIVSEVLTLLRSSLPSTVEICKDIHISPEESTIMADATQIHQVVMNLGTNAGHAMRDSGGMLTVTIKNVDIDTTSSSSPAGLKPGSYVALTIRDTGHGMNAKIMERIFDPYFTTKGPGEGSGIGLAVVQGIIKGHGGAITVSSKPGKGAAFQVFLPRVDSPYVPDLDKKDLSLEGGERILFVDDELTLVDLGIEGLGTFGYKVVGKVSSLEAWQVFQSSPDLFDLVVTDMTMPGLTGVDLARNVTALRADIPVILCTGHSDLIKGQRPEDLGVREIVRKPYQLSDIARMIRRVFEQ